MSTLLSLERNGTFDASSSMIPNAHKCAAMETTTYQYQVKIESTGDQLSPEGFLLNNELVQNYFDSRFGPKATKWEAVSCELIALTSARELAELCRKNGVVPQSVECCIVGSNGAEIRAKWTPERSELN